MVSRSSRNGALDGSLGRRRSPVLLEVILVGALLLGLGPQLHDPSIVPLPFVLGLAARGGADREPTLERLAGELETFVSRIRDGEVGEAIAGPEADAEAVDFELDRDDALGRLSTAIDELTAAVRERERRFDERERELRETNERLGAVIEASPSALVALDTDETVTLWNPAAERVFGWSEDEVLDEPLPFVPDDRAEDHREIFDRLFDGESIAGLETRRVTKDGERIDVSISAAPIYGADGEIVGTMGALEDITERKDRERRLESTSARLEALFENSPDMIDVLDTEGTIVEANHRFCEMLGYEESELVGTKIWEYEALFDAADVEALLAELSVGERRKFEGRYRRRDGSTFPVEVHLIRIDFADETRFLAISRDVTDRKADERRLRERERELQRYKAYTDDVLDAIDDVFYVIDEDGALLRWNESLATVSGYDADEIDSMDAVEFFAEADRPAINEAIAEVLETGTARVEVPIRTADGESIPYEFVATRLEDLEGETVVTGIGRDISERTRYERDLERTTELLEQAQRLASVGGVEIDVRGDPYEVTASDEFYRQLDLEPGTTLTPDKMLAQFRPDDRPAIRSALSGAVEDGEAYDLEARLRSTDGEPRWVRVIGDPVREGGETVAVRGSMQDVTDRKHRERELERYETIVQSIGDPVYTLDEDGTVRFVNDAIETLAGYDPEALIGDDVSALLPPPDLERAREQVRELLREEEGPYATVETDFMTADGDVIETETHIALLPSEDGEFAGTAGVVRDITDRKERERELERYETIIQAIGDPVYTLDEDGTFQFVNDAIEPLAGYEPETLIGADVESVMSPTNLETARNLVRELLREDKLYETFEMDLETADGDVIEAENHMALLPSEDGEFAGTAGVVRDITDRKERERELERTTELLEQAQRIAGVGGWELDVTADPYDLTVSPQLQRLFGRDPSGATQRDVSAALGRYHPDDRSRVLSAVEDAVERAESYDLEVRMYTYDDELRWMRTIGEPIVDDGEVVAVRGSMQDITDRKRRERELERTTDLLERVQRMATIGGWELDLESQPRTATWTDEMYRLHDLPTDATPDLERTIECFHPDDRAFVRERVQTALETGTGYDLEARIRTREGEIRWVRAISEPIRNEDGDLYKYRGTVQDISDRKRRELALESLHETARGLLNAETESTVTDLVVETAAELLETDDVSAGVYLLDSETNRFEPVSSTAGFADRSGGAPSIAVGDGDSVLWTTYVTGTQTVVDDAEIGDRSPLFGGDASGGLLVPIGDYGVFVLLASPATIDDETRRLFETLVATTEAAFDRLESEANLRERDTELAAQNRRLRRQIQITEIIRGIDRSLIGADGRDEIERTVPERLVAADNVSFAWIGDLDASGSTLEPRTWAGDDPEYLDAVDFGLEGESQEPAVRAARSGTPTVVENVVEGLQGEAWRTNALDAGFQSAVAVPLTFEEYSYGVLTVYADEPDAFTDLERSVFAELGEGIANAINAAQTQEALHAETLVELTLDLETDDVLSRIATATGAAVTYEGLGTHGESETSLFFETRGASAAAVRDALDGLVSVTSARLVAESDSRCLFEATVTGDVLASRLVRHGGSPRSITADEGRTEVTVDVPVTTDVREFVEMLRDRYERVDLRSRRHVQRTMHTRQELVTSLFEDLTDRQLEVLRTAYLAGFFEWPRESTGEEIAEMLEVTQPTVNRHLRIGQQRLLARLFDDETLSLADGS
ncbi:PAS domain S-box protein [Haloterrigena sp. SYSU A121-1]|uniref:histidine kinase n=1 Tax=Haloterrigena gelatinilytica TaxID=2741724 RepID=A0A8J8GL08_9EURY|nr:PAS domain S-box protein [Haloterrigena gelatinilytica]NUB90262.1 PAS domain S-box protein [Haloterrigena gelatinilytica]